MIAHSGQDRDGGALHPSWRIALPVLVALVAWILVCFHETFLAMAAIWARSETFTHGFVVPPLTLWLIWRQRHELAPLVPRPSLWGVLLLGLTGVAWLLGELAAVNAVTQMAATVMLITGVIAILGGRVAAAMAFPLGFLLFAVPIGEFVMPSLMEWTADATVLGLRASGIPVYREGLSFVIPSGNWSVVEACSGVRYLIASLMVGTLFAYLNYYSLRRRLIFILVSLIVPVFANWARAYGIVMIGHLSGNRLAVGVDHLIYGWIFFGVVIMLMFAIGTRWREDDAPSATLSETPSQSRQNPRWGRGAGVVAGLALVAAVWPLAAYSLIQRGEQALQPHLALAGSDAMGGWVASGESASFAPAYDSPPAVAAGDYAKDGRRVGLFMAYYRNQSYGEKLITSTNALVKSSDRQWVVAAHGSTAVVLPDASVVARSYELAGNSAANHGTPKRLKAWQWYWISGHLTASDVLAKVYSTLARLVGEGDDSAVVILYADEDQPGGAEEAMRQFVADAGKAIESSLVDAKRQR